MRVFLQAIISIQLPRKELCIEFAMADELAELPSVSSGLGRDECIKRLKVCRGLEFIYWWLWSCV